MANIPNSFNSDDVLPPGTYKATFSDLRASLLVKGDGSSLDWDSEWRLFLISNLVFLSNKTKGFRS